MKIFLTGATGYIGNAVALGFVKEGHDVSGLVRSDAGKPRLEVRVSRRFLALSTTSSFSPLKLPRQILLYRHPMRITLPQLRHFWMALPVGTPLTSTRVEPASMQMAPKENRQTPSTVSATRPI